MSWCQSIPVGSLNPKPNWYFQHSIKYSLLTCACGTSNTHLMSWPTECRFELCACGASLILVKLWPKECTLKIVPGNFSKDYMCRSKNLTSPAFKNHEDEAGAAPPAAGI